VHVSQNEAIIESTDDTSSKHDVGCV
jgi:hypothetical protein